MIKILILIDCDDCGQPLQQASVSSNNDPMVWQTEAYELISQAATQGWDFHKDHTRCSDCNRPNNN